MSSIGSSDSQMTDVYKIFDEELLLSSYDLYNILNDGSFKPYIHDPLNLLIVDTRSEEEFKKLHVVTAKHHSVVLSDSNFTMNLAHYGMIVLYGGNVKGNLELKKFSEIHASVCEYVVADVCVVRETFDAFKSVCPFLCTEADVSSTWERRALIIYPSVVVDGCLYQGRGDQATDERVINALGITHIVNITIEHRNAFPNKIKYLRLTLEDVAETNLLRHLRTTSGFIEKAINKGGRVLVHCNLGVSRSSTVTLAYLMKTKGWNLEKAYTLLKVRRSCARPNAGFLKQLSDWELEVVGERVTNVDKLIY